MTTHPPRRTLTVRTGADDGATGTSRAPLRRSALNRTPKRSAPPTATPASQPTGVAPRPAPAAVKPAVPTPTPARDDGLVRLSKRMSELRICSRREADEWIEHGWVKVDGVRITELGTRIDPDAQIVVDPAARTHQAQRVTILLHKPVGFVSGQAEDGYQPAVTLIRPDNRWAEDRLPVRFNGAQLRGLAPAGRLDIDSTGLLVLTQDGRIARKLIGEDRDTEKEYLVRVVWRDGKRTVDRDLDRAFPADRLALLRHGLALDDKPLLPAKVSWQNGEQLRIVLREGRKRQIRRMCEAVGLLVVGLKRVRIGSVVLGKLPPGQWRYLRPDESF